MEIISGIIILLGTFFILISAIGLIRMPDLFTRMSATTKASTLGVGLTLIGTAIFWQDVGISARVLIIISFLFLTAPVAAHIIGRAHILIRYLFGIKQKLMNSKVSMMKKPMNLSNTVYKPDFISNLSNNSNNTRFENHKSILNNNLIFSFNILLIIILSYF